MDPQSKALCQSTREKDTLGVSEYHIRVIPQLTSPSNSPRPILCIHPRFSFCWLAWNIMKAKYKALGPCILETPQTLHIVADPFWQIRFKYQDHRHPHDLVIGHIYNWSVIMLSFYIFIFILIYSNLLSVRVLPHVRHYIHDALDSIICLYISCQPLHGLCRAEPEVGLAF